MNKITKYSVCKIIKFLHSCMTFNSLNFETEGFYFYILMNKFWIFLFHFCLLDKRNARLVSLIFIENISISYRRSLDFFNWIQIIRLLSIALNLSMFHVKNRNETLKFHYAESFSYFNFDPN